MNTRFVTIAEAVTAVAAGRLLIIVDSENRENEGDFYVAAERATPELLHFMVRQGCGQLCVPVSAAIARRLGLSLMVPMDPSSSAAAFAVPLDHSRCKTGVSPDERAVTIRAMLDPSSRPKDFVRPGHVFPLIAREGGVLRRPGHTEAAVDLPRLAGLAQAGVLCEICSPRGHGMATRPELERIAAEFDLPIVAIDDLIRYRQTTELEGPSILKGPTLPARRRQSVLRQSD